LATGVLLSGARRVEIIPTELAILGAPYGYRSSSGAVTFEVLELELAHATAQ